eukprot:PhM_4_TR17446/c0_g1_i1/m.8959/K14376/PAP; poly(A) polymerase
MSHHNVDPCRRLVDQIIKSEVGEDSLIVTQPVLEDVLSKLRKVAELWFLELVANNQHVVPLPPLWYRLEPFGSVAVGTQTHESDVDVIFIVPGHTTRRDFFSEFPKMIEKYADGTEVIAISDAAVPILTFRMLDARVHVDLSFVAIDWPSCPTTDELLSNEILERVRENGWRSLQGYRVAQLLPRLIGCTHMEVFRTSVQFVKLWAMRREVYGNVFTYPGGVSWSILVARVILDLVHLHTDCNDLTTHLVLTTFFRHYEDIMSSKKLPLPPVSLIDDFARCRDAQQHSLPPSIKGWRADSVEDGAEDIFPVLNPSYPFSNSTYNLCLSSMLAIVSEMRRVNELLSKVTKTKEEPNDLSGRKIPLDTKALFGVYAQILHRVDVTKLSTHYIGIEIRMHSLPNPLRTDAHSAREFTIANHRRQFTKFCNFLESKLKFFLYYLECMEPLCHTAWTHPPRLIPNQYVKINNDFKSTNAHSKPSIARYFIALSIPPIGHPHRNIFITDEATRTVGLDLSRGKAVLDQVLARTSETYPTRVFVTTGRGVGRKMSYTEEESTLSRNASQESSDGSRRSSRHGDPADRTSKRIKC